MNLWGTNKLTNKSLNITLVKTHFSLKNLQETLKSIEKYLDKKYN
jgi:hypothetical protein